MRNKRFRYMKLVGNSIFSGIVSGIIVWIFLKVLSIATSFLWEVVPAQVQSPLYTVLVCTAGGLIVGMFRKKFGDYPEELMIVLGKVKKEKFYNFKKLPIILTAAFLPLVFASSVGPEAGLVGIITAICYWVADRLKTSAGQELNKTAKIITYVLAILAGLVSYIILNKLLGAAMAGFPSFELALPSKKDMLMSILYIIIGCLMAKFYDIIHHGAHVVAGKLPPILCETVAGLLLGISATFVPQVMFSGEAEIHHLMTEYVEYLPWMLIGIALLKVLITNVCIQFGLKGGHFFPLIFAGVAAGYGIAMLLFSAAAGEHVIFAAAVVTAAMLGANIKKPLIVVVLLLICFPFRMVLWLAIGAFAGSSVMSMEKWRKQKR